MTQMNEIVRGKRVPSRKFEIDAIAIKALRTKTGLSQPKFAALLNVDVGTLRNWEQGRREPTGPAKAFLTAIGTRHTSSRRSLRRQCDEEPHLTPQRNLGAIGIWYRAAIEPATKGLEAAEPADSKTQSVEESES